MSATVRTLDFEIQRAKKNGPKHSGFVKFSSCSAIRTRLSTASDAQTILTAPLLLDHFQLAGSTKRCRRVFAKCHPENRLTQIIATCLRIHCHAFCVVRSVPIGIPSS